MSDLESTCIADTIIEPPVQLREISAASSRVHCPTVRCGENGSSLTSPESSMRLAH